MAMTVMTFSIITFSALMLFIDEDDFNKIIKGNNKKSIFNLKKADVSYHKLIIMLSNIFSALYLISEKVWHNSIMYFSIK